MYPRRIGPSTNLTPLPNRQIAVFYSSTYAEANSGLSPNRTIRYKLVTDREMYEEVPTGRNDILNLVILFGNDVNQSPALYGGEQVFKVEPNFGESWPSHSSVSTSVRGNPT